MVGEKIVKRGIYTNRKIEIKKINKCDIQTNSFSRQEGEFVVKIMWKLSNRHFE